MALSYQKTKARNLWPSPTQLAYDNTVRIAAEWPTTKATCNDTAPIKKTVKPSAVAMCVVSWDGQPSFSELLDNIAPGLTEAA